MKIKLKFFIISLICLILLSNISFATQNFTINENIVEQTENLTNSELQNQIDNVVNNEFQNQVENTTNIGTQNQVENEKNSINSYKDLYFIDNEVEITEDIVNGDIYVIAQNIKITSNIVYGNVFVIAENVEIDSEVTGYAYIIANRINVNNNIEGMYVLSNTLNINSDATIKTDVKAVCDELNLDGVIERNLLISSENININFAGELPKVNGNITYSGNLNSDEEAILGEITKIEVPVPDAQEIQKVRIKTEITDFIIQSITALIVIAIVILLFNNKFNYENKVAINYVKDIAIGFGLLILIPIIAVVLCLTIIGLPIGIMAMVIYVLLLCISLPVASIVIAIQIFNEKLDTNVKKIFAGLLIYIIIKGISYLPVIGGIVRFLSLLFGFKIILEKIFMKDKKIEVKVVETNSKED